MFNTKKLLTKAKYNFINRTWKEPLTRLEPQILTCYQTFLKVFIEKKIVLKINFLCHPSYVISTEA